MIAGEEKNMMGARLASCLVRRLARSSLVRSDKRKKTNKKKDSSFPSPFAPLPLDFRFSRRDAAAAAAPAPAQEFPN